MTERIWDVIIGFVFLGVGFFLQKEFSASPTGWVANSYLLMYLGGVGFLFKFALMADGMENDPAENKGQIPEVKLDSIPEIQLENGGRKKPGDAGVLEILARFVGASYMDFLKLVGSILAIVVAGGIYIFSNPDFWVPGYGECRSNMSYIMSIYITTALGTRNASLQSVMSTSGNCGKKCPTGGNYSAITKNNGRPTVACSKHGTF